MSRLLEVLYAYLEEKSVTQEEFIHRVVAKDYGSEATTRKVMDGKADASVGIVGAAQEILGLTDNEADSLEAAGRQDAREEALSLQKA